MNTFALATDGAYIYAEAADGSQVKIRKSDLCKLIFKSELYNSFDLNELNAGEAYITDSAINSPVTSWVYVKTFATSDFDMAQFVISIVKKEIWFRVKNSSIWSDWKSITTT